MWYDYLISNIIIWFDFYLKSQIKQWYSGMPDSYMPCQENTEYTTSGQSSLSHSFT